MKEESKGQSRKIEIVVISIIGVFFVVVAIFGQIDSKRYKEQTRIDKIKKDSLQKLKEAEDAFQKLKQEEQAEISRIEYEKEWKKNNPKAARIKAKHPEWTLNECELLSNNKVWIGMTLDMLKYKRGLPDVANPSNYGNGTQWQWCWWDFTPSCFYDTDNDGRVDSYN